MAGNLSGKSQEEAKLEGLNLPEAGGLLIGGLLLIGGVYAWFYIRRQIRMISRAMFGTSSLVKGLERQADILAETPKSVSGMTKLCLPQIEADFPEFHWLQWKQICENLLKAYLQALSIQKLWPLETSYKINNKGYHVASEELKKQVSLYIEDQKRRGIQENYKQVRIHQTEISRYQKEAGLCIIKLQSAVEYFYEEIQTDEDKTSQQRKMEHEKIRKIQTRYNMELVYIQDISKVKDLATCLGTTCPNCGAPITKLGNKFCEYCKTAITPIDVRVWKLHRVEKE